MRDLRDPQKLGEAMLLRKQQVAYHFEVEAPLTEVYDLSGFAWVSPYDDGGFISSNPADHHSKTSQDTNHQEG